MKTGQNLAPVGLSQAGFIKTDAPLAQLKEMTASLENLEDIRDMPEALQTDESEAVND